MSSAFLWFSLDTFNVFFEIELILEEKNSFVKFRPLSLSGEFNFDLLRASFKLFEKISDELFIAFSVWLYDIYEPSYLK